jgi:hypothetical protein
MYALQVLRGLNDADGILIGLFVMMQQIYLLYLVELVGSWSILTIVCRKQDSLDSAIHREN